jgi:hypothetical protein
MYKDGTTMSKLGQTTQFLKDIRDEGFNARSANQEIDTNPYTDPDGRYGWWREGWWNAEDSLRIVTGKNFDGLPVTIEGEIIK